MAAPRQGLPVRLERAPQRGAAFALSNASKRARTRSIGSRSRGSLFIFRSSPAVAPPGPSLPCPHENLAGGLIGLARVLLGAWVAWSAVQQQINADRERAMADRVEADRLLSEAFTDYADGMATAWRYLVALPEDADQDTAYRKWRNVAPKVISPR